MASLVVIALVVVALVVAMFVLTVFSFPARAGAVRHQALHGAGHRRRRGRRW